MTYINYTKKPCIHCNITKPITEFHKNAKSKDCHKNYCKTCANLSKEISRHTRIGVTNTIYDSQVNSSKRRGHVSPNYSKKELYEWSLRQVNFDCLYLNWINSGYNKWKKPSCDRLDDYKPYTLDNLRIVTWQDNSDKGHADRKNGVNITQHTAVMQYSINGDFITEHYSQASASRLTGVRQPDIWKCCKGIRHTAGGFKWAYS